MARYDDATRERACEVMRVDGLAAAHVATGVSKPTLSRWAKDAQIDLGEVSATARNAAQARAAQLEDGTVSRLEYVLDLATLGLARHLEAHADMVELDDDDLGRWSHELERFVPADDRSASAKAQRRMMLVSSTGVSLRDLVGVTTRAIHDLALLRGEATERGEISVVFSVPRPQPETIVVVEQEHLGISP